MPEDISERKVLDYQNLSDRFKNQKKDFTKQYCNIYNVRLRQMKQILRKRIIKKWGDKYPICDLHKLSETDYSKCIVIGTIFKDQKLKPSVLKQLAESNSLVPQPVHVHFTDDSDTLYLEDELQRYEVIGNLSKDELVTGISCALLGSDLGKGKFNAEDFCFAGFQTQIERPILNEDLYVLFISGLDLVHIEKTLLSIRLLVNWLSGLIPDANDVNTKIIRLIIAGNSTRTSHEKIKSTISLTSRKVEMPEVIESVKLLDTILLELAQVIEVDVMPGEHDPSNHIMPQQAMHHCMFPNSMAYKSLNQVSNPYECELAGLRFLGSSGQPVSNILGFCEIPSPLKVLESCLKWSHIAPTAPDTLGCFPFYENDPFVIEHCPHVMFTGNQSLFDTEIVTGDDGQQVRLISIPEFANTKTVAILNLKNLDCFPMSFSV
ncbi:hypothetical protein RN001_013878 [Aquatica leii]|uniref:DNA polymerase delta subunit 2 n=1 Tax=Aquatica leii TaxID=1421715 RepID=A0AAN7QDI4_9COLE|nr:hypothetical protein RN001_013878 [Aquatica leii]